MRSKKPAQTEQKWPESCRHWRPRASTPFIIWNIFIRSLTVSFRSIVFNFGAEAARTVVPLTTPLDQDMWSADSLHVDSLWFTVCYVWCICILISWNYGIMSEIWHCLLMHSYLKNNHAKSQPNLIWNDRALGFLKMAPNKNTNNKMCNPTTYKTVVSKNTFNVTWCLSHCRTEYN